MSLAPSSHPGWFIWLRGMNGPRAQKVFSGAITPPSKDPLYRDRESVISERALRDVEVNASLAELERRYPAPQEAQA